MDMGHVDPEIMGLLRLDDRWIDAMVADPDIDVGEGPWCRSCGRELLGGELDFCDDCNNN